jgi:hypothetical protein
VVRVTITSVGDHCAWRELALFRVRTASTYYVEDKILRDDIRKIEVDRNFFVLSEIKPGLSPLLLLPTEVPAPPIFHMSCS